MFRMFRTIPTRVFEPADRSGFARADVDTSANGSVPGRSVVLMLRDSHQPRETRSVISCRLQSRGLGRSERVKSLTISPGRSVARSPLLPGERIAGGARSVARRPASGMSTTTVGRRSSGRSWSDGRRRSIGRQLSRSHPALPTGLPRRARAGRRLAVGPLTKAVVVATAVGGDSSESF